ncbi:MAG: hypothetical protein H7333_02390 [Bdellovibrionales bacterium]|nr:hypothetical protein [Oligoflexia bacterium]
MKTIMIKISLFTAMALSSTLVGCSGLGNKIDKESLSHMRRAALVGFTVDEREPVSGKGLAMGMLGLDNNEAGVDGGRISFTIKNEKHVDAGYDIATRLLSDRLHLTFIAREKVAQDAGVKNLFEKKNATIQTGVTPLRPYFERFEAQNIPQFYSVHWANKDALNAIAKSLNVDTLVVINSKTDLSASIVSRMSSTADVSIMFYDPKTSEFSTYLNQRGESIDSKDAKIMGFADSNEMHIQSLEAMKSAITQAVQKI